MEDPAFVSSTSQPFFVIYLDYGNKSNIMIPAKFFSTHIKSKNQSMKLKLTSDASDRIWEVKLDGRRFAQGWEDFSVVHSLRDGDVLTFRDNGDMTFHVTASGRSFRDVQSVCISSDEDEDDVRADSKKFASKKKPSLIENSRTEAESSSKNSYLVACVTTSNLSLDTLSLKKSFVRLNGLNERCCKIYLMNQHGKSWKLCLRYNKSTGQACIREGWRDFCLENGLEAGSFYRFKLVQNGTRPLLRFCSKVNEKDYPSERSSSECLGSVSTKQNKFLTITFKPYMLQSCQLKLPRNFVIENGINKAEKIILVDKDGGKWSSFLAISCDQRFYIAKGVKTFCTANGLKAGETFTLEFLGVEGTTAMLKFCLKSKMEQAPPEEEEHAREDTETRISAEGLSRCTAASKKFSADPKNLDHKKPLQTGSISDHVAKVKQSIVDTLTSVRLFRSELQIKAQDLEASLQEIDALDLI